MPATTPNVRAPRLAATAKRDMAATKSFFSQFCFGGIFYLMSSHNTTYLLSLQHCRSHIGVHHYQDIIITMARSKQQARKSKGGGVGGGGGGGNNNNTIVPGIIKASPIKRGGRGSKAARGGGGGGRGGGAMKKKEGPKTTAELDAEMPGPAGGVMKPPPLDEYFLKIG